MKHLYSVLTVGFAVALALAFGCNRPRCQKVKPIDEIEHDLIDRVDDWLDDIDATKPQKKQIFALVHRFMPRYEALRLEANPRMIAAVRELQAPEPRKERLLELFMELSKRYRSFSRDMIQALVEANRLLTASQRSAILEKETKPKKPFKGSWLIDRSIDLFLWQIDATKEQKKLTVALKEKIIGLSQPLQREMERLRVEMIRELARQEPDRSALEANADRFAGLIEAFLPQVIAYYLEWRSNLRPDQIEVINGYLRRFEPCEGERQ